MDDLQFWIAMIEMPVLGALFWMIGVTHRRINCVSNELKDFKTHVAEAYVSKGDLREKMNELLARLTTIDKKIDRLRPVQRGVMDE